MGCSWQHLIAKQVRRCYQGVGVGSLLPDRGCGRKVLPRVSLKVL